MTLRTEVEEEYRHPQLIHSSNHWMQLDVYIEDLQLALEYQGEQHYYASYWAGEHFEQQRSRDKEKRTACKQVFRIGTYLIIEA